jgi:hypothetical protein
MYEPYIDLVNIIQKIPYIEKEKIYITYKTLLPKKKIYFKYIKGNNKVANSDLVSYITLYFICSTREAKEYITLLAKQDVEHILNALDASCKIYKKGFEEGFEKYLVGDPIKPVFRKYI